MENHNVSVSHLNIITDHTCVLHQWLQELQLTIPKRLLGHDRDKLHLCITFIYLI